MDLIKQDIIDTDVSFIKEYYPAEYDQYNINNVGEHYKLLHYLSNQFADTTLADLGTLSGISALALGHNRKNEVISYDIRRTHIKYASLYKNIEFRVKDINDEYYETWLACKLIVLDIDPHDGIQERQFLRYLRRMDYGGLVLCDDIHLPNMKAFWEEIVQDKIDVTEVGHSTGTGIVNFTGEILCLK